MPSDVIEYAGFGILLVAAIVALWYLQPRKLPPNPETDGDLRPSSDRNLQDAALDRMRVRLRAKGGSFPFFAESRYEDVNTERERQLQLPDPDTEEK